MPVSTVMPVHGKEGNASKHGNEGNAKYFSENLAYYAPTMLILKPRLQYFSQYFAFSTSILKLCGITTCECMENVKSSTNSWIQHSSCAVDWYGNYIQYP